MALINARVSNIAPNGSPYSLVGEKLIDLGYSAIPCMPGSKFPGEYSRSAWHAMRSWNRYSDRLPTDIEISHHLRWPDAGVCLVLDHQIKVFDVDTDDAAVTAAILDVLPPSLVRKQGAKGFSLFYRGSPAIEPRSFSINRERVLDVLAYGRQTVLPPTIHPTTGKPYAWIDPEQTLLNTPPDQLPELPDDIMERLVSALEPFGYFDPPEHNPMFGDSASTWRELNDLALARLHKWVPDLGLPRLQSSRDGYRAVAAFRPSGSGKADHERNANLSIHRAGICDWGDDAHPYTPLDLVMACHDCSFGDAVTWLRERLDLFPERYDFSRFIANVKRKQAEREAADQGDNGAPAVGEPANDNDADDAPELSAIEAIAPPPMHPDPFAFDAAGGLLGRTAEWISSTALTPVKEFSTFAAIALMAGLFGRRAVSPSGLGLNVYLVTLAPTGYGKNRPADALSEIATALNRDMLVIAGRPTGDAALLRLLRAVPSRILVLDEVGMFLQSINGRHSNGATASLRDALIELYTRSVGKMDGKQYASAERDHDSERIWFPTLTMYGMSTPTEFYAGLGQTSQSDGFLNRLTLVAVDKQPSDQDVAPLPTVPPELVKALQDGVTSFPRKPGNLVEVTLNASATKPEPHAVPYADDEAKRAWEAVRNWQRAVVAKDETTAGVVQRAAEQTGKLATIRAISRSPAEPRVTTDDVHWAWAVVHRSIMTLHLGVEEHMASSDFERLVKAARRAIVAAGPKGLPRSKLVERSGVSGADPRQLEMALERLREAGWIEDVGTSSGRGRKGGRFVAAA